MYPYHTPQRIRDIWKNSYKSKTNGIPELENWRGGFLVARDRWKNRDHTEVVKQYNWAESWEDVYHDINHVLSAHSTEEFRGRNYHELWTEHNKLKLFFDFELKGPFPELPMEEIGDIVDRRINNVIEHSIRAIHDVYEIEVCIDDFAILQSTKMVANGSVEKYSFHVVLTRGVYFQDGKHLKNFFDHVLFPKELLEEDKQLPFADRRFDGVDSGVYGISRMLRMPLCSKLGEVRPLEIDTNHTFDQCLVTVCPPEHGRTVPFIKERRRRGAKRTSTESEEFEAVEIPVQIQTARSGSNVVLLEVYRNEKPEKITDATEEHIEARGFSRFLGFMNKYFRSLDDAADFYNKHNKDMRPLNAHGTYVSDWHPETRLFYVAREIHPGVRPMKTIPPFAEHDKRDFDNGFNSLL
jgi:hypothetical protein